MGPPPGRREGAILGKPTGKKGKKLRPFGSQREGKKGRRMFTNLNRASPPSLPIQLTLSSPTILPQALPILITQILYLRQQLPMPHAQLVREAARAEERVAGVSGFGARSLRAVMALVEGLEKMLEGVGRAAEGGVTGAAVVVGTSVLAPRDVVEFVVEGGGVGVGGEEEEEGVDVGKGVRSLMRQLVMNGMEMNAERELQVGRIHVLVRTERGREGMEGFEPKPRLALKRPRDPSRSFLVSLSPTTSSQQGQGEGDEGGGVEGEGEEGEGREGGEEGELIWYLWRGKLKGLKGIEY